MPLFPQESVTNGSTMPDASQRMAWTREGGTRKIVLGFLGLMLLWYGYDKVQDHFLLQKSWKPLQRDSNGLTVVGTLDVRGSYDRNMFRIIQANKEYRVELTDFGWRSIFDPRNGPLFSDEAGNAIKHARDLDDLTGNAMLEPYLESGVSRLMGRSDWLTKVSKDKVILVEEPGKPELKRAGTLESLIKKYSGGAEGQTDTSEKSEGGSGTTHEVEHGLMIPPDTAASVCPVVLTGREFNEVSVEEHAATLAGGKTWTLHLGLTPEGRSRYYQWSHDHVNENLVFVLNHELLAAGRVTETLDVNEVQIGPLHDEDAVKKLVAYVSHHRP